MVGVRQVLCLCIFIGFVCLFGGCRGDGSKKVTIATAANMRTAMQALVEAYEEKSGVACQVILGSSGKLTAQILEGAPFDVFVAANMSYPEEVYRSGKALGRPKEYAYGKLVLWTMEEQVPVSIGALSQDRVRHIAMANPKTAPYGVAAKEVLQHYGLYETLSNKLVYGESVAQTDQFITTRSAQIGFTALSSVFSGAMKDKGHWMTIDTTLYSNIGQGVVLVKHKEGSRSEAQDFYDFLFTFKAKQILKEFGYLINE
ncbi:molybdate ABC transporter substrate-binding protein [Arenibacter aquaticus]|uniref:Molybdate ABC transporter substrate-binding protein n=1 Tax=Arenibacter aquaticus TaxID=2489054 RepID=A0A3S0CKW0_9FLAO|nr:molybdate ABC transporter substrate-binding protein [Arenibacter aquaticus]RTE53657.1 molybdate ABC transporter substrate-binding protein [Arenibacter aquaticus]